METATLLKLGLGLGVLLVGAELLVRGAARLAMSLGISPLVTGLTVVAFGTSAPETLVSVLAVLRDQPGVAVGNILGSNIFNVLFILGVTSMITPLVVARKLVRVEVPILILASLVVAFVAHDASVRRVEGLVLLLGLCAYLAYCVHVARREQSAGQPVRGSSRLRNVLFILAGLTFLVLGSRWLVAGAVQLATTLGISELIVGLTIVAAGTSLPEVATSIVAAMRGERDIAVGNVVGSCIFNLLGVLGLASSLAPDGVAISTAAIRFDLPVMIATSLACLPIFWTGLSIARWEGTLLLSYYVAYVTFLVLSTQGHSGLRVFSLAVWTFVIPLTVLVLGISIVRAARTHKSASGS